MLYQGEDIAINIKVDTELVKKAKSFKFLCYPTFNTNDSNAEFSQTIANKAETMTVTIQNSKTKVMPVGVYTIEILMESNDGDSKSIYQQREAFELKFAKIGK
jgi:hypothetical protein